MPRPFPDQYTHNHARDEAGAITFECTANAETWPWLNLVPTHPILIQTANFWASFDSGVFMDEFRADSWTALTKLEWACGRPGVGYPARGRYTSVQEEKHARYTLELRDADDELVADYAGEGVTFRTRNFEGWRGETKEKLRPAEPVTLGYVSSELVDVATTDESFLAPLSQTSGGLRTTGLITKENGLRPNHPYIGGSGDHVNSTHMGEIARQFGCLMLGRPFDHTGGAMELKRYVELGVPFEVALLNHSGATRSFTLQVLQADRVCAELRTDYL